MPAPPGEAPAARRNPGNNLTPLDTATPRGMTQTHLPRPDAEPGNHVYHIRSFFSAARRTNQEAPPLLSGRGGRRQRRRRGLRNSPRSLLPASPLPARERRGFATFLSFPHIRSSPSFFSQLSPIGRPGFAMHRPLLTGPRIECRGQLSIAVRCDRGGLL